MLRYLKLIIALSLTLSGDILFSLAVVWRVLSLDGSAKTLGLFLCLITVFTYCLQKFSAKFKKILEKAPIRSFMWIRLAGACFAIAALPILWKETIWALYLAGMVATILTFLSTITLEAIMAQEVLQYRLSSNKASRMLQIATLASSFLGAAMLGPVLSIANMKSVLVVNIITYSLGFLVFAFRSITPTGISGVSNTPGDLHAKSVIRKSNSSVLWLAFIGLTLLMTQISAFNFLVPLISLHEKMWTASQYGLIDAAAEFGGFLATFIMLERGKMANIWVLSFLGIMCVDTLFFTVNNAYVITAATLFLGFFISTFRIKQREFIYDSVVSTDEILEWTGRITAMTVIIRALAPMCLAFFYYQPSLTLMMVGIIISLGMIGVKIGYFYFKRHPITITKNILRTA